MRRIARAFILLTLAALLTLSSQAELIWIEGENPTRSSMHRHPFWYDKVHKDQLSGGDFITNWDKDRTGQAVYNFTVADGGEYEFWVRANPVQSSLFFKLFDGDWTAIDLNNEQVGNTNIAEDDKPDIRFIAWSKVGKISLKKGPNSITFRMDSKNNHHGMLDCFVFSTEPFTPNGINKPGAAPAAAPAEKAAPGEWNAFAPPADPYTANAAMDLRSLNEKQAGDGGFIAVKDGHFIHSATGEPVRFWAVNGPPADLKSPEALSACAKMLAKHGVNMVRIHGGYFDKDGNVDPAKIQHALDIVKAMKAQGIYCHFSTYFPLWLDPKPHTPWLEGYDGKHHPFAALYFNKAFQAQYRSWWKALLTTADPVTGARLIDDPAVSTVELVNEDSYFFWTFNTQNIPDEQLRILESQFGDWLKTKYGSLNAAAKAWANLKTSRDNPAEGRMGFRALYDIFTHRSQRDKDTAAFLLASQTDFYSQTREYLKSLGFRGLVTASNWTTANPQILGPLEKYCYTSCDFIDRHGYFECFHQGENAAWSIRPGHTYWDRSALRFDGDQPGKPKSFVNSIQDIHYGGKPSMISETTFTRPNRYRSEAPLYYAAYGALQDSDCIVNFAMDGATWATKPGYFVQPWTVMTPAMMGQFPAAALIYRRGLVNPGDVLVDLNLKVQDELNLAGTPMPQDAAFDDLRAADVPKGIELKPGNVIDPLVHYAGRTSVNFTADGGAAKLVDLTQFIDRSAQTVVSTNQQLKLDYGKGVLKIDAPLAQSVSGGLKLAGLVQTSDLSLASDMDLGHIIAVSLDGKPIATSQRILLQVMSEEMPTGFQTQDAGKVKKILKLGGDPWLVRELRGTVQLKRADAAQLKVTALDHNGYPLKAVGTAAEIKLAAATVYYLISP